MNRKVRGATPTIVDGVAFKSKFEAHVYKRLKEHFPNVEYEKEALVIVGGFIPAIYYKYTKWAKSSGRNITYTPDFTISNDKMDIFIEVKGYINDVFPLKFKLFMKFLQERGRPYKVYLVNNKTDLEYVIQDIKEELNEIN